MGLEFKDKERLTEFLQKTRELYPDSLLLTDTIFRHAHASDRPITPKAIYHACKRAAQRAAFQKVVHPHTLRHCFATHHAISKKPPSTSIFPTVISTPPPPLCIPSLYT